MYRLDSLLIFSRALPSPLPLPLSTSARFLWRWIKEPFYARIRAPFSKNDDERPFWRALQYASALSIHNTCKLRVRARGNANAVREWRDTKNVSIYICISTENSPTSSVRRGQWAISEWKLGVLKISFQNYKMASASGKSNGECWIAKVGQVEWKV